MPFGGALVLLLFWLCGNILAAEGDLSRFAQEQYRQAEERHRQKPADLEAGWQFGRACFDLAEFAANNTERAGLAERGIAVCEQVLSGDSQSNSSNSAPAHYYLGMNLGQLARTKGLGALKLVGRMEREFLAAAELDPKFDHAGPDRNLGLLYRDAPSFSVGSRTKAEERLNRAVSLAPDYPENRLALIEGLLKWNNRPTAKRELATLEELWPKARETLKGPAWASAWADWDARRAQLRRKLGEPARLESPRGGR